MFNQDKDGENKTWCNRTTTIEAPVDTVFWLLTTATMLWWVLPFPEDWHPDTIEMEPRLGGKLVGRWNDRAESEGIMIGTITALRKPELLTVSFSFLLNGANVTFHLGPDGLNTTASVMFQGPKYPRDAWHVIECACNEFLRRLKAIAELTTAPVSYDAPEPEPVAPSDEEDTELALEYAYQQLQQNLIQVRQSVAQAIATEKQLEQQVQKNKDQADTWHNRAHMAIQQGSEELQQQALQRKKQYEVARVDLEEQLQLQRATTLELRDRLIRLEGDVQKAYTRKQVLIAREKAAKATLAANEILARTTTGAAMSVIERMERKLAEREALLAAEFELKGKKPEDKVPGMFDTSNIEDETDERPL